jgi:hypothetical protein
MRGFRAVSLSQINLFSLSFARFSDRREYISAKIAEDHTPMSKNEVKENLKSQSTWKRGLYMLLYIIFSRVAEIVLGFVILFQFLLKLFTGETNERLLKLGQGLSTYVYQAFQGENIRSKRSR